MGGESQRLITRFGYGFFFLPRLKMPGRLRTLWAEFRRYCTVGRWKRGEEAALVINNLLTESIGDDDMILVRRERENTAGSYRL